jgi:large subunit ribosomal protein L23
MALFGLKKKKTEAKDAVKKPAVVKDSNEVKAKNKLEALKKKTETIISIQSEKDLSRVLMRPRVTEKATMKAEHGVYVFEVDLRATKKDIARAVEHYYGTKPIKISIVPIPSKEIFSRIQGKRGRKSSGKKAYVYLKEGEKMKII